MQETQNDKDAGRTETCHSNTDSHFNLASLAQELESTRVESISQLNYQKETTFYQAAVQHADREECNLFQRYTPGLHRPGDNYPLLPERRKPTSTKARSIPKNLLHGYINCTKNPISAITEYGQIYKLKIGFKEVAVPDDAPGGQFAYQCTVDGKPYPIGLGRTKKEAKTESAIEAFEILITVNNDPEVNNPIVEDFSSANLNVQSTEHANEHLLENTNPLLLLHEICMQNHQALEVKVHDSPTEFGFQCDVIIN